MAITTNLYANTEEITLVEVSVGGNVVGICEESAVEAMLAVLGYTK